MIVDQEDSEAMEKNKKKKKKRRKKKNVLVGIRINSNSSRDLLNWAIVKVADPGDCVIVIHVCQSSDRASKDKPLFDEFLEGYKNLCDVNKVALIAHISTGSSVRKTLVTEAKTYAAGAVVLGTSKPSNLGGWSSTRYFVKRLPPTTDILALNNGKVVFRRSTNDQLPGLNLDPKPSFSQSDLDDSETENSVSYGAGSEDLKDEVYGVVLESKRNSNKKYSSMKMDRPEPGLGWPLLRTKPKFSQTPCVHNMSVVQWVMTLPDRSPYKSSSIKGKNPSRREILKTKVGLSSFSEPPENLEDILNANSSCYKWFSPDVLKTSTSHFSSENLIGKGGCNRVYKGILPDGKPIAVKVTTSSKQAWNEFSREVDIISSLHHKNITPFLGICIEDNTLISVYDFFSQGSLEEKLYDRNKEKNILSWEVRFKLAVLIAEALNYLHDECPRAVVHRDVKTSNILLTDQLEPQLADFGLAVWGPTESSFQIVGDVAGTFGYLAPEYFMFGKMSNKIDVYAFGIVLLELLSGRRAISTETSKGQRSLVMWARPIIESGNVKKIVDPNLEGKFIDDELQRMVLAATLCITRASRLRPSIGQVLDILRGENDTKSMGMEDSQSVENGDDEVYPKSSSERHLSLALLGVDDDGGDSLISVEQTKRPSLEDYLTGRWSSRSSSFN